MQTIIILYQKIKQLPLYFQIKMEIQKQQLGQAKENQPNDDEELISDFSMIFKNKSPIFFKKPPKLSSQQSKTIQTPNWLLQIPAKLNITRQDIFQRRYFDQRRWKSMIRCDDINLKIISSVGSIWNYLFSSKGSGNLQPLDLAKAHQIIKQSNISFLTNSQFDRKNRAIAIFQSFCSSFQLKGEAFTFMKLSPPQKTQKNQELILNQFQKGLRDEKVGYIYFTHNNILCPFGYEQTPLVPLDAYKPLHEIKKQNLQLWIMNGYVSRNEPSFCTKRWSDIKTNLETIWPYYTDLEQPKKGVQKREEATELNSGQNIGSSNCILQFRRL